MYPPTPEDYVFTQVTFEAAFKEELRRVENFILIESAFITITGVQRFIDEIAAAIKRRVKVCVFVQKPQNWNMLNSPSLSSSEKAELEKVAAAVKLLRNVGAHVTMRAGTHLKLAIVDGKRVFGGSLNILSYTFRTEEEMNLWIDPSWARATARRRRLYQCKECREQLEPWVQGIFIPSDCLARGVQIRVLRRKAGLTQQQLAEMVGTCRRTIVRLERGGNVDTTLFFQVFQTLNQQLVMVPPQLMPLLNHWLTLGVGSKE